jgi:hypothetical protein
VIACRNDAGQFLPSVLILKGVNKKQEIADGLTPRSDVYMNRKTSYISTHLFNKSFRKQFLEHKTSGNVLCVGLCKCFESNCVCPFQRNTVPEFLFSTSACSESTNSMETASPKMALICVNSTSANSSQNVLTISAKISLTTLSSLHHSDNYTKQITASGHRNVRPVEKISTKYSV